MSRPRQALRLKGRDRIAAARVAAAADLAKLSRKIDESLQRGLKRLEERRSGRDADGVRPAGNRALTGLPPFYPPPCAKEEG